MGSNKDTILNYNKARLKSLYSLYDPVEGIGSPIERKRIKYDNGEEILSILLPVSMFNVPLIIRLLKLKSIKKLSIEVFGQYNEELHESIEKSIHDLRFTHDFEYWAFLTIKIEDKETGNVIPFKLNKPQRTLLKAFENDRQNNKPIRVIVDKARQWGGSTLTQIYMGWIQTQHKRNWHSAIVADVDNQAKHIRGMYTKMAENYPKEAGTITFEPYEQSQNIKVIKETGCIVGVGSAQHPEALRSYSFHLNHLSEVGLWKDTQGKTAKDIAQALRGTVPFVPYSMAVLESTARGVGTFFHKEWLSAVSGTSGYTPVFIAWFVIERYQRAIKDYDTFIEWMLKDEYAMFLWGLGATLEGINWYFDHKAKENFDDWRMHEEFPSTAEESFTSSGQRAFAPIYVNMARRTCIEPEYIGELFGASLKGKDALKKIEFKRVDKGNLFIWSMPDTTIKVSNRYGLFADIGGRTSKADKSVVKVFDRYWMHEGGIPEVVATWRGNIDQDIFAWKAVQLAQFYNKGLLAVETNSLRTEKSEGDHFLTILDEIADYYDNLYARVDQEKLKENVPVKYGFHTNLKTKPMIIDVLNGALRDQQYIERDIRACDEMDTFEIKENGTYGAVSGCHDDIVVVTAGGLWLCLSYMDYPKIIDLISKGRGGTKFMSEATI